MTLTYAFFIYLIIWWIVLFTVLPIGVNKHNEEGKGFDSGAPEKPDMKKKLILTTLISVVVFLAVWGILESDLLSWEKIANE